jgi:hypothetical protein
LIFIEIFFVVCSLVIHKFLSFFFFFLTPLLTIYHEAILKRFQVFNADNSLIYVMQHHFTIFLPAGGCGLRDAQEVPTANNI